MTETRTVTVTPGRPLVQRFTLLQNDLGVIRPRFVTSGRASDLTIALALVRVFNSQAGAWIDAESAPGPAPTISHMVLLGAQIVDGETVDLPVPPDSVHRRDVLALRISVDGAGDAAGLGIVLSDGPTRVAGHLDCSLGEQRQDGFGVEASLAFAPPGPSRPLPPGIAYSPVSQCNLNCPHCISADTRARPSRLTDGLKAELARWAAEGHLLLLSSDYSGDLLWADHRFGGELAFVVGLDVPFRLDTNGVYLNGDRAERLARSKVTNVNISLDAARDATFRRIRKGAPALEQVLNNVRAPRSLRERIDARFSITLGFTLMASNVAEWCDFIELGAALGVDAINTTHVQAYTAPAEAESLWHRPELFNEARVNALRLAAELAIPMSAPPPFHAVPEIGHRFCRVPWESALILGNGDVRACCVPGTLMGNLHEESMAEIWQGERYRQLRATVNGPTPPAPCSICPMFRQVGNRASYLQHSGRQPGQRGATAFQGPFLG